MLYMLKSFDKIFFIKNNNDILHLYGYSEGIGLGYCILGIKLRYMNKEKINTY